MLGRAVRTLRQDFEERYGYRPWLRETFVDEREHTGVSLRAANWVRVGESAGRGRNDRVNAAPETRKAVYVRTGPGLARAPRPARPGVRAAGRRRGARRQGLGSERVQRGAPG